MNLSERIAMKALRDHMISEHPECNSHLTNDLLTLLAMHARVDHRCKNPDFGGKAPRLFVAKDMTNA